MGHDSTELDPDDGPLVEAMLASVVDSLCEQADKMGWDEPARLLLLELDALDHGDDEDDGQMGFVWRISGEAELEGHPFYALFGQEFDNDCVGVVLVVEGWARPAGTTLMDAELRFNAGEDGRCEIRSIYAVLRDGSWAQATGVRGGTWHRSEEPPSGRVPAALARLVGLPSCVDPASPAELASRAWRWMVLSVVNAVNADMDRGEVPHQVLSEMTQVLEHFGALDEDGQVPRWAMGDAVVANLSATDGYVRGMPGALGWLVRQGNRSWDDLAVRAHDTGICDGAVQWLLEASDERVRFEDCDQEWERRVLRWCDGGMLGMLFDNVVPSEARISELWSTLSERGALTVGEQDLARLGDELLGRVDGEG